MAFIIVGGSALLQAPGLHRRGQTGELWTMLALTVVTLGLFALHELNREALQYPMVLLRMIFTPVGYWIVGY